MRSHELAKLLLTLPDSKIVASVDIEEDGKVFAQSICDVFKGSRDEVVVHFELADFQGEEPKE